MFHPDVSVVEDDADEQHYPRGLGRRVVATRVVPRGSLVVSERGVGVAVAVGERASHRGCCHVCLQDEKHHVRAAADVCNAIIKMMLPLENALRKAAPELAADGADLDLVHLWIRVIVIASLPGDVNDDMRHVVHDWRKVLKQLATLHTSAPSQEWLLVVTRAAIGLWDIVPDASKQRFEFVVEAVRASPACAGKEHISPVEALVVLAGQLNRNGYSIRHSLRPNQIIGWGLFPAIAMINHSCSPNAVVMSHPDGLKVYTITDIQPDTEILVSYINVTLPRNLRRRELSLNKEFDCTCFRCDEPSAFKHEHELDGFLCPDCRRTTLRPSICHTWLVCRSELGGCSRRFPAGTATGWNNDISQLYNKFTSRGSTDNQDLDADIEYIQALEQRIPKCHHLLLSSRLLLRKRLIQANRFKEAHTQLQSTVKAFRAIMPSAWPELHELELMMASSEELSKDQRLSYALAAVKGLQVVCDSKHPMLQVAEATQEHLKN